MDNISSNLLQTSLQGLKRNCHSKISCGKQNNRTPELVCSHPLINPDYRTSDRLAVKYSVFEYHILHGQYLLLLLLLFRTEVFIPGKGQDRDAVLNKWV